MHPPPPHIWESPDAEFRFLRPGPISEDKRFAAMGFVYCLQALFDDLDTSPTSLYPRTSYSCDQGATIELHEVSTDIRYRWMTYRRIAQVISDLLLSAGDEIEIWDGPFEVWVPSQSPNRLVLRGALTTDEDREQSQAVTARRSQISGEQ